MHSIYSFLFLRYTDTATFRLNGFAEDNIMIKLIASDLDGTLLRNGAQELSPRAVHLIHELTQKGIHFVAASGRQYDSERHIFREIRDDISYISDNGSLCVHQGEVISCGHISDDLALRIIDEARKNRKYELLISRLEASYIEEGNPDFENYMKTVMNFNIRVVKDIRDVELPVMKIAVANLGTDDNMEYLNHLKNMFGQEIKAVTSRTIWIDFITPGCSKGKALKTLMKLFGIKPEECMAFGDEYNDVEMLELVGKSYAMSDAAPGIAEHAAYVTDSVEDILEEVLAGLR